MTKDRRSFLKSTALAGTAGLLTAALGPNGARAAMGNGADWHSMASDGTYAVVPLAKPAITLGVVQSRVRGVRVDKLQQDREANLVHMLDLIDNSFHFGGGADILFFHEFPITGYNTYRNAYAPNLFSEYQPTDLYDSKAFLKDKSRWK